MKVAIIGECMVELSKLENNNYKLSYGGDTLNTAAYLVRCGANADYFTVLGQDPYSLEMFSLWESEGIGTEHVKFNADLLPGLYVINNDETGERFFHYWRDSSAAKTLFSDFPEVFNTLQNYPVIYLSGITLSIYSPRDREKLFQFLAMYRTSGGLVAFDNNYRPKGWLNNEEANATFKTMLSLTDIALISYDDEVLLHGEHTIEQALQRYVDAGVQEVVVKNGAFGCHVYFNEQYHYFALEKVQVPVDTTAAGDSFNGAYLAAKLNGKSLEQCLCDAQACSGTVIMHKGAIIDKAIPLLERAL